MYNLYPRTGHEGTEGEQRYTPIFFLISVLDGGGWSTQRPGCFIPGKHKVPIVQESVWAPGPVGMGVENIWDPPPPDTRIRSLEHPASSELL